MQIIKALVVALALLWLGGLIAFVDEVKHQASPQDAVGDGIVVLTGGGDRINAALILLERGHAKRLLITGVHPHIGPADLSGVTVGTKQLFECCVDLGKSALNTRGNAAEAADWAAKYNYRKLIIVTANYHMPRALLEFRAALPNVVLVPYPVAPRDLKLDGWWMHPGTTSLLAGEYTKYLLALVVSGRAGEPAQ